MPRKKTKHNEPIAIRKVLLHFNRAWLTTAEQELFIAHFEQMMRSHSLLAHDVEHKLRIINVPASRDLLSAYQVVANHSNDEAGVRLGRELFPLLFSLRRSAIERLDAYHAAPRPKRKKTERHGE
ncbi:hypothetical protein [Comamonas terrigena]|uniref:hypothetical protein n=1 Tax=Comamonas terrigena TaxID=32013 RepID=UPI00289B45D7|nr:hypothetical protein [Comamonas terrigena]